MPTSPASTEPLVDIATVARFLRVPTSRVYEWTARDAIPCYRLGRVLRFRLSEVEGWLADQRATAGGGRG